MDAQRIKVLAASLSGSHGDIANAINAMNLVKVVPTLGGIGLIMKALGPSVGAALLDNLQAMSETMPELKWAFTLINRGDLDFGDSATRAMIDALCPPEVATALKAVAEVPDTTDYNEVGLALEA